MCEIQKKKHSSTTQEFENSPRCSGHQCVPSPIREKDQTALRWKSQPRRFLCKGRCAQRVLRVVFLDRCVSIAAVATLTDVVLPTARRRWQARLVGVACFYPLQAVRGCSRRMSRLYPWGQPRLSRSRLRRTTRETEERDGFRRRGAGGARSSGGGRRGGPEDLRDALHLFTPEGQSMTTSIARSSLSLQYRPQCTHIHTRTHAVV